MGQISPVFKPQTLSSLSSYIWFAQESQKLWIPGFMLNWWDYCLGKHFTKGWANLMKASPRNTKPSHTFHFSNAMEIQNAKMINSMEIQNAKAIAIFIIVNVPRFLSTSKELRLHCFYIYRCIFKTEIEKDVKEEELEGNLTSHVFLTIFLHLLSLKSLTFFFS